MIARLQRTVLQLVVICLALAAPLAPTHASIVGTDAAIAMSERAEAVARVNAMLMREDVRGQLEAFGVDPHEAMDRVNSLTNAELAQLQSQLGELPAGGDVLGVLGVVLVVLLVLELLGVTNVFTGV
ncbi:MAG: PA2779 family protein [Gammaproteobacteria bacterium]|nr:PA2779 family protein [Gammaproteobacteria bacterium]